MFGRKSSGIPRTCGYKTLKVFLDLEPNLGELSYFSDDIVERGPRGPLNISQLIEKYDI